MSYLMTMLGFTWEDIMGDFLYFVMGLVTKAVLVLLP